MKRELYNEIIELLQLTGTRGCLKEISKVYPKLSSKTLGSIYAQEYQKKMKRNHHKFYGMRAKEKLYSKYVEDVCTYDDGQVLVRLGEMVGLSAALLARIILEHHLMLTKFDGEIPPRNMVTQMLKDSTLIDDPKLAVEIQMCVLMDEVYGPIVDTVKHSIGHEYEVLLQVKLEERKLAYLDEDMLREKGYDKTPDFKLEIPIAVNGHVVNWIESKASFGDDESHQGYLKDQFWSYWNRFGPGLVIYWFGFIDDLDTHQEKGIMLMDRFPEDIVIMDPLSISNSTLLK